MAHSFVVLQWILVLIVHVLMMKMNDAISDFWNGSRVCRMAQNSCISLGSPSRSHVTQALRSIIAGLLMQRGSQSHISLLVIMYSGDDVRHYSGVQSGSIVKSRHPIMISQDTTSNNDWFIRGAAAVAVELSKLGSVSRKKYGEPLVDHVFVCGFE